MSRHCRSCGHSIDDRPKTHFLCRACYGTAARQLKTGREKLGLTCEAIGLTPERCDLLLLASSRDNSPEVATAVEWLQATKQALLESRNNG